MESFLAATRVSEEPQGLVVANPIVGYHLDSADVRNFRVGRTALENISKSSIAKL